MHILLQCVPCKYFYQMSRNTDRINHKITNKESYALLQKPTNATFISKETMETNEETESIRQKNQVVYAESTLVENKKTEGQEKTKGNGKVMEDATIGNAPTYV